MIEFKVNQDDSGCREALKYSLQPLISSAQLFNAAPLPIKAFSLDSKRWKEKLMLGVIVQSMWAIILVGVSSVCLVCKRRLRLDGLNAPFFTYILYNMELCLGLLNCSLVFLACQLKRFHYDKVINHMVDILKVTGQFGKEQDLVWLRNQFNKYEMAGIFYIIIIVLVDGTYYWKLLMTVCTTGAYLIPSTMQFLSLMQYAYVVTFAYRKCRAINAIILTIRYALKSNLSSYCSTICTLRKQHMLLHRLVFEVNWNFGPLIILSNFSVLIAISITCLEMYQYIHTKTMTIATLHYLGYSALWVLMYVCKLLLVLYPNHLMENEVSDQEK